MPAGTSAYVPLANITLSSAVNTLSFGSISQAYRDLVVVVDAVPTSAINIVMLFNNQETSGLYGSVRMIGAQTSASSTQTTWDKFPIDNSGVSAGYQLQTIINIMDYSTTDKHKPVLFRFINPQFENLAGAGRYLSTAAVTSIQLRAGGQNWAAGSSFALYGVSA